MARRPGKWAGTGRGGRGRRGRSASAGRCGGGRWGQGARCKEEALWGAVPALGDLGRRRWASQHLGPGK